MSFLVHCLAEVLQVIAESLLLLADVEFLDVVDQFLLQSVLVVFDIRNLLQSVHDVGLDLLHARFLVRLYAGEQCLDVVHLLGELLLQGSTLLAAELDEVVHSLVDGLLCSLPFLVCQFFHIGLGRHVGQAQQRSIPVGGLRNACLCRNLLDLLVIVLHQRHVDGRGVSHNVLFYPDREINLASFQILGDELTYLHFLLSIQRSNTCGEVESLAVQRLNLHVDLLFFVGYGSFSEACH